MYIIKVHNTDGTKTIKAIVEDKKEAQRWVDALKRDGYDAYYVKE